MTHDSTRASAPNPGERLKVILRDYVSPILEPHGFRRIKYVYEKRVDGLNWIVELQRSRWDDATESQFTLNCGVFIPGVTSLYFDSPERARIGSTDCCIHTRIGMLAKNKLDKWWKLRPDDDVSRVNEEVGVDLNKRLMQDVFPFFDRFCSPEDVLQFLKGPRVNGDKFVWPGYGPIAFCYAAALASQMKWSQDVEECLNMAITESVGTPVEGIVMRLKNRLRCS